MKEPTQRAIDAANEIRELQDWGMLVRNDPEPSEIIQSAIDEAVREALEKAADRAIDWFDNSDSCDSQDLRAAILGEALNQ